MAEVTTSEPGKSELVKIVIRRLDKIETTGSSPSTGNGGS
jgi:hypothetical protein